MVPVVARDGTLFSSRGLRLLTFLQTEMEKTRSDLSGRGWEAGAGRVEVSLPVCLTVCVCVWLKDEG